MVTALVSDLGKVRPVCMSRFYLNRALDALENGNKFEAGVLLREGIARYLEALCQYYDCQPKRPRDRTPSTLARSLWKNGHLPDGAYQWIREAIDYGNRLAHAKPVKASLIECSITLVHWLMDRSPELIFPTREGGGL